MINQIEGTDSKSQIAMETMEKIANAFAPEGPAQPTSPETSDDAFGLEEWSGLNTGWDAYLVFGLNDSQYAIQVQHVREIITSAEASPIPGAPDYLTGVINLRGRLLPLVDLRRRFNIPESKASRRDCFLVLMLEYDDEIVELGIKIDSVEEVIRIAPEQIDAAASIQEYGEQLVFSGVARTHSGVRLILDAQALISQMQKDVREQYRRRRTQFQETRSAV